MTPAPPRARLGAGGLLVVLCLLAGCGSNASSRPSTPAADRSTVLRVAWINQGAASTEPWTAAHAAAARRVEATFGRRVRATFLERVAVSDADATIARLVRAGNRLVIATSYPFAPAMLRAAATYPSVRFEQARGRTTRSNLGTFSGADEEPVYLAGMAAASTSRTGHLGFVGTVPEAETIRHIDAFTQGARSVDPHARVEVRWMGSWYDPTAERRAGRALLDAGVDVLASGSISTVLGRLARTAGIGWVGHDKDRSASFPDVWLTGAVPDWGPFYVSVVRSMIGGTWRAAAYYGSMADHYTNLATLGRRVSATARAAIQAQARRFRAGAANVFTGPVRDASGRLRVRAGHVLPLAQRLRIDWYVAGVVVDHG